MTAVCARATAPQPSVPDGQITCPVPIEKINAFVFAAKHFPNRAVSSHQGALAIVTDAGRDAMDAIKHRWRKVLNGDGKVVWVLRLDAGGKVCPQTRKGAVTTKPHHQGRSRRKPLKP